MVIHMDRMMQRTCTSDISDLIELREGLKMLLCRRRWKAVESFIGDLEAETARHGLGPHRNVLSKQARKEAVLSG